MDYWHSKFICPYYKWSERLRIGCEGKHILKFDTVSEIQKYTKAYCAGWKWQRCPHADKLNQQYEEENKHGR